MINNWSTFPPKSEATTNHRKNGNIHYIGIFTKLNTNLLAERLFPSTEFLPGYPLQSNSVLVLIQHILTTNKIAFFFFHTFVNELGSLLLADQA